MKKTISRICSIVLCAVMLLSSVLAAPAAHAEDVTSGRFKSNNQTYLHLCVDWKLLSATQNSANVEIKVIVSYYSLSLGERTGTLKVGNQTFEFTSGSIVNTTVKYREYEAAKFTVTVPMQDGKVAVDLECVWNARVTYSKVYFENLTVKEKLNITVPSSMLPSVCYGDVSGDKVVDAIDLLLFRRYLAAFNYDTGTSTITVNKGADANGDGQISSSDLSLIRKYLAKFDYATGTSTVVLGPN